ncbi:hypothetical protein NDU88_001605 [Pleurodeles waltl]|uniref:Uncharacterized protein n=1 Tax=Pleurodeles waltl TaxID=8319 RepID=A0AAV7KWP1_PLEWA|nr:hypothetical protein NDU88_001605 [Pleurodeles waltl]
MRQQRLLQTHVVLPRVGAHDKIRLVGLPPLVVLPPATAVHQTGGLDIRRTEKPARPTELRLPAGEADCLSRKAADSPRQAPLEVVCRVDAAPSGCQPPKDSASPAMRLERKGSRRAAAIKVPAPSLQEHALLSARAAGTPKTRAAQREHSRHQGSAPPLPEATSSEAPTRWAALGAAQ